MTAPRRNGFTLLEILVVLAVLGVVSTIGVTALVKITDHWRETTARLNLHDHADAIFELMASDIAQVLSAKLTGIPLRGDSGTQTREIRGYQVVVDSDRMVLPIQQYNDVRERREQLSVRYTMSYEDGGSALLRIMGPLGADPPEGARMRFDALDAFKLAYLPEESDVWQETWHEDSLPAAVRVSMALSDPERPFDQLTRERVFYLHVQ